jgi:hypothetical protein
MSEVNSAIESKASNEVIEELKSELKNLAGDKLEELKEMNLKQGEEIEMLKKAQEERPAMEKKSLGEVLKDAYVEGLEKFKAQGSRGMVEVEINTKAISDSNITGDIPQAMREAGINKTPKQAITARALMFNGTTDSPVVDWIEKVNETGVPIFLAELDAFPEEETDYQVFNTPVKKIGGMTKVSEEKLEDITWMSNEIRAELVERHEIEVEKQLLNGDGLGNNLAGLIPTYAQAFVAPAAFALNVANANRTDALRVAIVQIRLAQFAPNYIMLNPVDVASMELEKGADGHYVIPPFRTADGMTVKGISVIETTEIAEDNFLVGDFSKGGVFVRRSPRLEIGLDGTDFSTDKRTVKLSERLAFRVKGRDVQAFVKGDFTTAIAAILKP